MDIKVILGWPSLAHELALEQKLFGTSSKRLTRWLQQQLDFIDDQEFARKFSDNIDCFDAAPIDYNHRLIHTDAGSLLGGIRFYGLDITRPFVEVIAHDFADTHVLCDAVKNEWSTFSPQSLRLTAPAGTLPVQGAVLDVSIHAAMYDEMTEPRHALSLCQGADISEIDQLVVARYERVEHDQLKLGRNIGAADLDDLTECHQGGGLYVANLISKATPIGMIAVRDGAIGWLQGDEVVEEVIDAGAAGNGYAVQMQAELAALRQIHTPQRLLIGTIDLHNHASRKSAERAGRPEVMRRVFVPI